MGNSCYTKTACSKSFICPKRRCHLNVAEPVGDKFALDNPFKRGRDSPLAVDDIDAREFATLEWSALKNPQPVYVQAKRGGAGIAFYEKKEDGITIWAFEKVYPLTPTDDTQSGGPFFSAPVQFNFHHRQYQSIIPLKYVITAIFPDQGKVVFQGDERNRFEMDVEELQKSTDIDIKRAIQAAIIDNPQISNYLTIVDGPPPPGVLMGQSTVPKDKVIDYATYTQLHPRLAPDTSSQQTGDDEQPPPTTSTQRRIGDPINPSTVFGMKTYEVNTFSDYLKVKNRIASRINASIPGTLSNGNLHHELISVSYDDLVKHAWKPDDKENKFHPFNIGSNLEALTQNRVPPNLVYLDHKATVGPDGKVTTTYVPNYSIENRISSPVDAPFRVKNNPNLAPIGWSLGSRPTIYDNDEHPFVLPQQSPYTPQSPYPPQSYNYYGNGSPHQQW